MYAFPYWNSNESEGTNKQFLMSAIWASPYANMAVSAHLSEITSLAEGFPISSKENLTSTGLNWRRLPNSCGASTDLRQFIEPAIRLSLFNNTEYQGRAAKSFAISNNLTNVVMEPPILFKYLLDSNPLDLFLINHPKQHHTSTSNSYHGFITISYLLELEPTEVSLPSPFGIMVLPTGMVSRNASLPFVGMKFFVENQTIGDLLPNNWGHSNRSRILHPTHHYRTQISAERPWLSLSIATKTHKVPGS